MCGIFRLYVCLSGHGVAVYICICIVIGRNTQPRHVGIIGSSVVVIVAGICPEYSIIGIWTIGTKGGGIYAGTHRGQRIVGVAPRAPVSARQFCGTVAAQMLIGIFLRAVVATLHEEGLHGFFFTNAARVLRRPCVYRRGPCVYRRGSCVYCGHLVYIHAANGAIGYIPAPQSGQQNHVLTGAGNWAPPSTLTYINAKITGFSGSNLTFATLSTSPTCPNPFVWTNSTTFTSPNIPGNYKIDLFINTANAVAIGTKCVVTPVIGGVSSTTTISTDPISAVPGPVSGVLILTIPANTTLTFIISNMNNLNGGGTITIVSL